MAKKYKLTGCARFLIFLVIVGPLVYLGVSFAQGENPIAPIKDFFNEKSELLKKDPAEQTADDTTEVPASTKKKERPSSDIDEVSILEATVDNLKKRIKEQDEYIDVLEDRVEQLEAQNKSLRKRDIPASNSSGN